MLWTLASLVSAAALSAANPDPGPSPKDCAQFVAHYRELIQHRAVLDRQVERGTTHRSPRLAVQGEARLEGARAAQNLEPDLQQACREANGSQYECVMTAERYDDLASCQLHALPVLDRDERTVAAELQPAPRPETPDQRAAEVKDVIPDYVRSGKVDVEALGTGSGAAPAAAPAESEVVQSGR